MGMRMCVLTFAKQFMHDGLIVSEKPCYND